MSAISKQTVNAVPTATTTTKTCLPRQVFFLAGGETGTRYPSEGRRKRLRPIPPFSSIGLTTAASVNQPDQRRIRIRIQTRPFQLHNVPFILPLKIRRPLHAGIGTPLATVTCLPPLLAILHPLSLPHAILPGLVWLQSGRHQKEKRPVHDCTGLFTRRDVVN